MKLFLQMFSGEGAVPEIQGDTPPAENGNSPEAEFEELIKGKYSDVFKNRVQGIIDKRFSKMKTMEKSLEAFSPLTEHLSQQFPEIEKGNTEALVRAFLEKATVDTAGKTEGKIPSEFLESAERLIKLKAAQNVRDTLLREENELRKLYPSFDLKRELSSSPEMRRLLTAGIPLRRAFEAVNMEKIMGSVLRFAVMKARVDTAESIRRDTRIQENSLSDRASSTKHTDVNNLTESEIRKIISDVSNGARVTFKS